MNSQYHNAPSYIYYQLWKSTRHKMEKYPNWSRLNGLCCETTCLHKFSLVLHALSAVRVVAIGALYWVKVCWSDPTYSMTSFLSTISLSRADPFAIIYLTPLQIAHLPTNALQATKLSIHSSTSYTAFSSFSYHYTSFLPTLFFWLSPLSHSRSQGGRQNPKFYNSMTYWIMTIPKPE